MSNGSYPSEDDVVVVDVGGLGGLQECWRPYLAEIFPVVIEPNPPEAESIRNSIGRGQVVEVALSDRKEQRKLHVTKSLGCTSVLKPHFSQLAPYSIYKAFNITHEIEVSCIRYDTLALEGKVPSPDAIKLDIQGFEYQALLGFGDLLKDCLAIQLEAHLYPIYEGQYLLHDVVELLSHFGLKLRKLEPVQHFDGDIVEVDGWFTRDLTSEKSLDERRIAKLELISSAWGLPRHTANFGPHQFD